jgi:hypothetical protein
VFLGGAAAILVMTGIPLAFNPEVIDQYHFAVAQYPPRFLCPTFGSLLRLEFGEEKLWLNFIAPILGLAWFLFHWRRHRLSWEWKDQINILLFMSLLTASYGVWPFDLVVLLIPVLHVAVMVFQCRNVHMVSFSVTALLGFDILALLFMNVKYTDQYWHLWMTPMVLYCFLRLRGQRDCQLQDIH